MTCNVFVVILFLIIYTDKQVVDIIIRIGVDLTRGIAIRGHKKQ